MYLEDLYSIVEKTESLIPYNCVILDNFFN